MRGNQTSATQGPAGSSNPTWTSTYNLLDQETSKVDPDAGNMVGETYDGNGNLTQTTDGRCKTTSYKYDALDRKIGMYDSAATAQIPADPATGTTVNQLGAWAYDNSNNVAGVTHAIGQLTTATTYLNNAAYVTQQSDFNVFGEPTATTTTVPNVAGEGALAGDYKVSHIYTANSGLLLKDVYPAKGGLPAESVLHTYKSALDLPDGLTGVSGYTQTTSYDAYSRVNEIKFGPSSTLYTTIDNQYDPNSSRLTDRLMDHTSNGGNTTTALNEQAYTYDLAGNITAETGTRQGSAASAETQCYTYDGLDQLTSAWTANDKCAATPTAGNPSMVADNLGVSAAYWTSWTFDSYGDRKTQTQHAIPGGAATDTTGSSRRRPGAPPPPTATARTARSCTR